jgi:hypothetical protein
VGAGQAEGGEGQRSHAGHHQICPQPAGHQVPALVGDGPGLFVNKSQQHFNSKLSHFTEFSESFSSENLIFTFSRTKKASVSKSYGGILNFFLICKFFSALNS